MLKIGSLEVYGIIYKVENLVNHKVYIGKSVKGFDNRYNNDLYKYTHNKHLKHSIDIYGIENFDISKMIDVALSKDELDLKEKIWISITNAYSKGYNDTLGGEGIKGLPKEKHGMYGVYRYGEKILFMVINILSLLKNI